MIGPYLILADWDEEACVWVATSEDVTGLATEADSIPQLIEKLEKMLPDLLQSNGELADPMSEVPFSIVHRHVARPAGQPCPTTDRKSAGS
jgi:hypothetical protein